MSYTYECGHFCKLVRMPRGKGELWFSISPCFMIYKMVMFGFHTVLYVTHALGGWLHQDNSSRRNRALVLWTLTERRDCYIWANTRMKICCQSLIFSKEVESNFMYWGNRKQPRSWTPALQIHICYSENRELSAALAKQTCSSLLWICFKASFPT